MQLFRVSFRFEKKYRTSTAIRLHSRKKVMLTISIRQQIRKLIKYTIFFFIQEKSTKLGTQYSQLAI